MFLSWIHYDVRNISGDDGRDDRQQSRRGIHEPIICAGFNNTDLEHGVRTVASQDRVIDSLNQIGIGDSRKCVNKRYLVAGVIIPRPERRKELAICEIAAIRTHDFCIETENEFRRRCAEVIDFRAVVGDLAVILRSVKVRDRSKRDIAGLHRERTRAHREDRDECKKKSKLLHLYIISFQCIGKLHTKSLLKPCHVGSLAILTQYDTDPSHMLAIPPPGVV